jgi:hypothetical protein
MFNKKIIFLSISHLFILLVGFAIGIYSLPILTAPPSLEIAEINQLEQSSVYEGEFVKDLDGSDLFHWGEAKVSINSEKIIVNGSISPGPDFQLYLTNEFIENEEEFLSIKDKAKYISEIKSFKNFSVDLPDNINIEDYNTIVIWCESYSEFITAAQYK